MEKQLYENYQAYLRTPRWRQIARQRMQIDGHRCVMCGSKGTARNPLETHHLTYKSIYHEDERVFEDLVTLCRVCHKSVHRLMNRVTSPSGRRGWKDNSHIPDIAVFKIGGEIEFEEVAQ